MKKKCWNLLMAALLLLVCSCAGEYDDTLLTDRLDDLEKRMEKLEQWCSQTNTNLASLQSIISALQEQDYITNVTPITQEGTTIGYTIQFAKSDAITIYHGKDGKDGADGANGADGADGTNGTNGTNGTDGTTYIPSIGVAKNTADGLYYWTLDGEWLTDAEGNMICAQGKDGADGTNGTNGTNGTDGTDGTNGTNGSDGKDGITPKLKIEAEYWYVSYDNGTTWQELGKATGPQGASGAQGPAGPQGEKGDSFFQSVTQSDTEVTFVLADGTTIVIPTQAKQSLAVKFLDANGQEITTLSGIALDSEPITVSYVIECCGTTHQHSQLQVEAMSNLHVVVTPATSGTTCGTLTISAGDGITSTTEKVTLFVSDGRDRTSMNSLTVCFQFPEVSTTFEGYTIWQANEEAGTFSVVQEVSGTMKGTDIDAYAASRGTGWEIPDQTTLDNLFVKYLRLDEKNANRPFWTNQVSDDGTLRRALELVTGGLTIITRTDYDINESHSVVLVKNYTLK